MNKTEYLNRLSLELAEESIQLFGEDIASGKNPLEYHMLMVSEIAEASECARKNEPGIYFDEQGKPQGEAVELADAIMRILNYCGHKKFDISEAIKIKREYNMKKRKWKTEGKTI